MRDSFINSLTKYARSNKKIFLIVGDLGFSVIENFKKVNPRQFLNVGVAEQNMASIAAGIASEGFQVFIYSIANFSTFRCAEQIRNDIDYHKLPVTVVSVGGGVSYGSLGYSHHAIQDYGLMRLFPNFSIIAPGDPMETEACMNYIISKPAPYYLRLTKSNEKNFFINSPKIYPGRLNIVRESKNNKILLSTGSALATSFNMIAKKKFSNYGIYTLPVWGQKYKHNLYNELRKFDEVISIEDHIEDCGFGSWICESIGVNNINKLELKSMSFKTDIFGKVGSRNFLEGLII